MDRKKTVEAAMKIGLLIAWYAILALLGYIAINSLRD